jgi:hypothetical protein
LEFEIGAISRPSHLPEFVHPPVEREVRCALGDRRTGLCCIDAELDGAWTQFRLLNLLFKRYGRRGGVRIPTFGSMRRGDGDLGRFGLVGTQPKVPSGTQH